MKMKSIPTAKQLITTIMEFLPAISRSTPFAIRTIAVNINVVDITRHTINTLQTQTKSYFAARNTMKMIYTEYKYKYKNIRNYKMCMIA